MLKLLILPLIVLVLLLVHAVARADGMPTTGDKCLQRMHQLKPVISSVYSTPRGRSTVVQINGRIFSVTRIR